MQRSPRVSPRSASLIPAGTDPNDRPAGDLRIAGRRRSGGVPAAPFVALLDAIGSRQHHVYTPRPASAHFAGAGRSVTLAGGDELVCELYSARFGVCTKTAWRHVRIARTRRQLPRDLADRIAALAGVPYALVIACSR